MWVISANVCLLQESWELDLSSQCTLRQNLLASSPSLQGSDCNHWPFEIFPAAEELLRSTLHSCADDEQASERRDGWREIRALFARSTGLTWNPRSVSLGPQFKCMGPDVVVSVFCLRRLRRLLTTKTPAFHENARQKPNLNVCAVCCVCVSLE